MKQDGRIEPAPSRAPPSPTRIALAAAPIVFVVYAVALGVALDLGLAEALAGSAANTIPTLLFALPAYRIVATLLVGRRPVLQVAGHAVLAVAYAVLTYWLLMIMLGIVQSASLWQFSVEPFPTRASTWQLLQNVTVYGIVATLAYLGARPEPVALILPDPATDQPEPELTRYFIRSGEEIRPIDISDIVSIAGADDYAQVVTAGGSHLVRMTLAEFEKSLDAAKFVRVHRSHIVNVERIERAEPTGGGRLLLHMEHGQSVPTSRAGARLLRERVI
ncbi:MAG TPA: LytTR family DNA-binding domain-containing protein [Allosphingosinicella sp.]|jgi:DNA-binding LytR/AlgR family response regulator